MDLRPNLTLFGMSVQNDQPPNAVQPRLVDGVHMRWAFKPELGFPLYGFYVFRRPHRPGVLRLLSTALGQLTAPESFSGTSLQLPSDSGSLYCQAGLSLTARQAPYNSPWVSLNRAAPVRHTFPRSVRRVEVVIKFNASQTITISALFNGQQVAEARTTGTAGGSTLVTLRADRISALELSSGAAWLVEIRFVEVISEIELGWEALTGFEYPLGLPVHDLDYPVSRQADNFTASELKARQRVVTGSPPAGPVVLTQLGTISVTSGSPIVVGSGTNWTNDLVGATFSIQNHQDLHMIAAVLSPTRLVLNRAYQGSTLSGLTYQARSHAFGELYDHLKLLVDGGAASGVMVNRSLPQAAEQTSLVAVTSGSARVTSMTQNQWSSKLVGLAFQAILPGAGTITLFEGSALVEGTSTSWDESMAGMLLKVPGDGALLMIEQVLSPTLLRLNRLYTGPAVQQQAYVLYDNQTYTVIAVPSTTALDLDRPYARESKVNINYRIYAAGQSEGLRIPPDPQQPQSVATPREQHYPLDTVLLSSLEPRYAQMLGLYWVDRQPQAGVAYDYLVAADYNGKLGLSLSKALSVIRDRDYFVIPGLMVYDVIFNRQLAPAAPLTPPSGLSASTLPGGEYTLGGKRFSSEIVGLNWDLGLNAAGVLNADRPVLYHLWRVALGSTPPASAPATSTYQLRTGDAPILVVPQGDEPPTQQPSGWPDRAFYALDNNVDDGWYSYRVSGIDIFGRHSAMSAPSSWYDWKRALTAHAFAVQVQDKLPPPAPRGVEAWLLDPKDPTVRKDAAYQAWRASLSAAERDTVVGLRVCWKWTRAQRQQAPDLREFRLYFSPGYQLPDNYNATLSWAQRLYVVSYPPPADPASEADQLFELFLPAPGDSVRTSVSLTPTRAAPLAYAHIGVSAADGRTHTADAAKWAGTRWGNRTGNEGPIAAPAKIVQVLRTRPPVPRTPPPDSARVYATPADYHGRSYYDYRWAPETDLRTHIYRALDEAVFQTDWQRRSGNERREDTPISVSETALFPSSWDVNKRTTVAAEINRLVGVTVKETALGIYRGLSNDALLVLAGLPGIEVAFSQLTKAPLEPGSFTPGTYKVYTDTLDGCSRNRYFYRAGYVDKAHNPSERLSLSSPPVWLPDVQPPRAPILTSVQGGERAITISWAKNHELNLLEYRIYRAESIEQAGDLRSMTLMRTQPAAGATSWQDTTAMPLRLYYYRLVAVRQTSIATGTTQLVSALSELAIGQAVDNAAPAPANVSSAQWVKLAGNGQVYEWGASISPYTPAIKLDWPAPALNIDLLLQRKEPNGRIWETVMDWTPGALGYRDEQVDPQVDYLYRLQVRKANGLTATGAAFEIAGVA